MDIKKIKEVMDLFDNSNVAVMELEVEGMNIRLEKQLSENIKLSGDVIGKVKEYDSKPIEPIEVEETADYHAVISPLVGTFYSASSEGADPFVEIGSAVKKGDTLCIIEAMKVMNEIKSDTDGIVKEILVSNGQMVEFDQVIFNIGN